MFFLGKSTESTQYAALIDISSGSVGVGIIESDHKKPYPKIIYAHRIPMRLDHTAKNGSVESIRRVKESLISSALMLSNEGIRELTNFNRKATVSNLFVTCSSPWAYTIARSIRYEDDQPYKITKSMLDQLVQSAEEEILSTIREHSVIQSQEFQIVEKATVDIAVNDYLVSNPLLLKGAILSLTHIVGLIPKDILETVADIQENLYQNAHIRAHTYMLVIYCVLRDIFPKMHSVCIIDITEEATEFGIIENNLLVENSFIQFGQETLIRQISKETGRPIIDITTDIQDIVSRSPINLDSFKDQIELFEEKLREKITEILERRSLPENIILTSNTASVLFFKGILENTISKCTNTVCAITIIEPTLINKIAYEIDDIRKDIYLSLAARFFHKLNGCAEMDINQTGI